MPQPCSGRGQEQRRVGRTGVMLIPQGRVPGQRGGRAGVQRDQPGLPELGVPDGEHALVSVEVAAGEGERFPDSDAACCEKADQGLVGGGPEPGPQRSGRGDDGADLGTGVDVRGRAVVPAADQAGRGNLDRRVGAVQVGGEPADHAEPDRLPCLRGPGREHRPCQGVFGGDRVRAAVVEPADELAQQPSGGLEPEAQRAPQRQVVFQRVPQRASVRRHAVSSWPGQGRPSGRSAPTSTLA